MCKAIRLLEKNGFLCALSVTGIVILTACFFQSYAGPDDFSAAIEIGPGLQPAMAVDSTTGTIHLVYVNDGALCYRTGTASGDFSAEEQVFANDPLWNPRVVLDKNGDPHVAVANGHYLNRYTYYTNRIGGSWKPKFAIFDKLADTLDRATMPHLVVDDDMTVYAGVFTVGNAARTINRWGSICRVENVSSGTPVVAAKSRVDNWVPQLLIADGKLWVAGRNTASADRRVTISEHSKTTLARTGSVINAGGDPTGEIAQGTLDRTGEIHLAGTIRSGYYTYLTAGWYNTLSRAQAGTGPIRYRTTRDNPNGAAMPVRDRVAANRVYVLYWSDQSTTMHESEECESTVQLYFMRVENGDKVNEMMPVTDRSEGHGPTNRVMPCMDALPDGGMAVVISECSGNLLYTTIGRNDSDEVSIVSSSRSIELNGGKIQVLNHASTITVVMPPTGSQRLVLYALNGSTIGIRQGHGRAGYSFNGCAPGAYILETTIDGATITRRIQTRR